jgi:hypothetical protein
MKLSQILEVATEQEMHAFKQWQQAVRAVFPNATFVGSVHQSQAVDWMSKTNEVAGDWKGGVGEIYKPGSGGREVLDRIEVTLP